LAKKDIGEFGIEIIDVRIKRIDLSEEGGMLLLLLSSVKRSNINLVTYKS
jgi:hypothetical protein